jgi:hypothetical protein
MRRQTETTYKNKIKIVKVTNRQAETTYKKKRTII